ncbi:nitroreductase family protein [Candidatus Kapabacteria bacterium]|nr:nitroreductase family protein [Candidatus Kapabacteria bacterium]
MELNTENKFIDLNFNRKGNEEMLNDSEIFYLKMNQRRTVRDISNDPIDPEIIKNIVLTAGTAPSGANIQPWKFAVVSDNKLKNKIRLEAEIIEKKSFEKLFSQQKLDDIAFTGNNWEKPFLTEAPYLIVVFKEKYRIDNGTNKIANYYPNESIGLAMGLLFAAIHNAGLVTIPYTPHPISFLKRILDRPDNEAPVMLLPVGLPKDDAKIPDKKRKSIEEIMLNY